MPDRFDYLIVGAGFAGATCARELADAGKRVLVIDQRDHIGGNAYDYYDDAGVLVHKYGAHIFHTNSQDVFDYVSRFTEWRPYEHRVLSSVNGKLLPVPINDTTLEAFGGDLAAAEAAMVTPYTRKQWGPYADELLPTVKARIKPRAGRDDRYFTDTYQVMPRNGYHKLFELMLSNPNISVELSTNIDGIRCCFDRVIWTGPIDEYFYHRLGKLPYRSARFEFRSGPAEEGRLPAAVVNYPTLEKAFTRLIDFTQLTGQQHSHTTVAAEFPTDDGEPFWPVPTEESADLYRRYRALADSMRGVYFTGRLGSFQYFDMHQVIAQSLTLTKKLLQEEPCIAR